MTLEELQEHLQTAIQIEWSTIPPYLCARWSLVDGRNEVAAACIEDVLMEEMLHLTLACNLLNAIGGTPRLTPPGPSGVPPSYPTYLPHSDDAFLVNLLPFSAQALETFLAIERPARSNAPPEPDKYQTIAQFYEAVRDELTHLGPEIFTGPVTSQIDAPYYYGGGGAAFPITDLASAERALALIVDEGEGIHHSIWDGDHQLLGEGKELAHYFRFNELSCGRRYVAGDTPQSGPTGEPILIDYSSVLPMKPNPKASDYPDGSELRAMTDECNASYSRLLTELQAAFTGHPAMLVKSVQTMMELRYQAIALMRVPVGQGLTAGPAFEWRD
ncbi:MAG: ferritin-like protein [Solirubrobacteraceae bacterium]